MRLKVRLTQLNDLYVLRRDASKDFEAKTFSDLFRRSQCPYQNELEGGIERYKNTWDALYQSR